MRTFRAARRHAIAPVLAAFLIAAIMPGGTLAAAPAADRDAALIASVSAAVDPAAAYRVLTPAQRARFDAYFTRGRVELSSGRVRLTGPGLAADDGGGGSGPKERCWTITKTVTYKNFYGTTLWQWKQRADWCGDGYRITKKLFRNLWGQVYADYWRYKLHADSQGGGVGFSYWQSFGQAEFSYCPPGAGCSNWRYPWIDMTMRPNGGVDGSLGT